MENSVVHNNLAHAKRKLAGIILQQKDELARLEKLLPMQEKEQSKALQLYQMMENHPNHAKQGRKVDNINQKVAATEEAIAQYKMNLIELGVK